MSWWDSRHTVLVIELLIKIVAYMLLNVFIFLGIVIPSPNVTEDSCTNFSMSDARSVGPQDMKGMK